MGLSYICATAERFFAVSAVLNTMVAALPEQPSVRLLKHIIRCYLLSALGQLLQPAWAGIERLPAVNGKLATACSPGCVAMCCMLLQFADGPDMGMVWSAGGWRSCW